jgi:hypothetical protein
VAQDDGSHVVGSTSHRKADNGYIIYNHEVELRSITSEVPHLSKILVKKISNKTVHMLSGVLRKPEQTTKVFEWSHATAKAFGNNPKILFFANTLTSMGPGCPDSHLSVLDKKLQKRHYVPVADNDKRLAADGKEQPQERNTASSPQDASDRSLRIGCETRNSAKAKRQKRRESGKNFKLGPLSE